MGVLLRMCLLSTIVAPPPPVNEEVTPAKAVAGVVKKMTGVGRVR